MMLKIEGELTDHNAFIAGLNRSRWIGAGIKRDETSRVAMEIRHNRDIQPVQNYPVRIIYHWYSKDRRKDIDNVAFAKKFINDALVDTGILKNDGRKCISGFEDFFYIDKEHPRVMVEILQGV